MRLRMVTSTIIDHALIVCGAFAGPTCTGLPASTANVKWPSACAGAAPGFACLGSCTGGKVGNVSAVCGAAGSWGAISGACSTPGELMSC